jgi:hypothetical protein
MLANDISFIIVDIILNLKMGGNSIELKAVEKSKLLYTYIPDVSI